MYPSQFENVHPEYQHNSQSTSGGGRCSQEIFTLLAEGFKLLFKAPGTSEQREKTMPSSCQFEDTHTMSPHPLKYI